MLFLMLLLILTHEAFASNVKKSAGTTLFNIPHSKLHCLNQQDILKLRARQTFEELIPPTVKPDKINSQYIRDILKYFKKALSTVNHSVNQRSTDILKEALLDTLGAHLKSEILPTIRFAYYAGCVPYRNVREIHDFYEHIKEDLNTQGLGWRQPNQVPQWSNLTVAKIQIGSGKFIDPCSCLVTKRNSDNCIYLPSPKPDSKDNPFAIALPFKSNGLISLLEPASENILLKYYTTASRCILDKSPAKCRHSDFVNFNNEFWHWMKRDVAPHLGDDKLYAAYGGVLRIAAAVQNYGRGLSRRNSHDQSDLKCHWNPLKKLSTASIHVNADWTPKLYIGMVFIIAVAICLLQVLYNYILGDANACRCKKRPSKTSLPTDVAYTQIDSNFPAVLPKQSTQFTEGKVSQSTQPSNLKCKVTSLASIMKQKVYDLNENEEKIMAIAISENEDSDTESASSKSSEEVCEKAEQQKGRESRAVSPPKIETPVAELKLEKQMRERKIQIPMYSTSTLTRSEATFCPGRRPSETGSTTSTSDTSDKWASSSNSKRRSRLVRNFAWAKRIISRETRRQLGRPSCIELEEVSAASSATNSSKANRHRQ